MFFCFSPRAPGFWRSGLHQIIAIEVSSIYLIKLLLCFFDCQAHRDKLCLILLVLTGASGYDAALALGLLLLKYKHL